MKLPMDVPAHLHRGGRSSMKPVVSFRIARTRLRHARMQRCKSESSRSRST
jgi:hypothetical protein